MIYDKPFKTYEEQIDILKNKYQLIVNNDDFAIELLKTISYYDLINGTKDCFLNGKVFAPGTKIETLYMFKILDKNIQNILFKYSVYVENTFKTKLAYLLSMKYGVDISEYLDTKNFKKFKEKNKEDKKNKTINKIKNIINSKYLNNPSLHYKKNHNHIPAWILFKNIYFTDAIDLYTFLKKEDKKEIINDYYPKEKISEAEKELLKTTVTIVRKFRNKIAHNYKVINYKTEDNKIILKNLVKAVPKGLIYKNDYKNNIGLNDMFAMILSLIYLLNNKSLIIQFIYELKAVFNLETENKHLVLKYMENSGIPKDISKRLDGVLKHYHFFRY